MVNLMGTLICAHCWWLFGGPGTWFASPVCFFWYKRSFMASHFDPEQYLFEVKKLGQAVQRCVVRAKVPFFAVCGAHQIECRPFVNSDARSKNQAKQCTYVWIGPGYYFLEGVGSPKRV